MEKDFHYYATGFLARAAGFNRQEALTIAYASQYVDNSTESEPIRVGNMLFDPVRTAHNGLKAFNWGVQKRVYIPFHFIPPNPFRSPHGAFSYVTMPDSAFARMILERACSEPDQLTRLVAIGIALHTLADTWAHRGFSGLEDPVNDVKAIYHHKGNSWKRFVSQNLFLDILPKVGHAQAGHFPDQPFLRWKYTRDATKEQIERNNTADFFIAAETIYRLLARVKKINPAPVLPWEDIHAQIEHIFTYAESDIDKRCGKWKKFYLEIFGEASGYHYEKNQWRKEALSPLNDKDIAWDDYSPADFKKLSYHMTEGFYDTPWVRFHRAALKQRNFVLEQLF